MKLIVFDLDDTLQYQKLQDSTLITHKLVDKGRALKAFMRYYGIEREETTAFGDNTADIPMLVASGTGVAMGNAVSRVKEIADFITISNDEDGVAEYIETYLL
jgi:hydroxymethylpyrimidine pyrophosphatase-like HAD family hydrolase